jgi:hypothetical protein
MPKEIEDNIRKSVEKAHPEYSKERVDNEVYATMNKKGLLKGRKKRRK